MNGCARLRLVGLRPSLALALALGSAPALPQPTPEPPASATRTISAAERLAFVDDHLKNTRRPTTLRHVFVKTGSLEAPERDEFRLALREREGGGCCVAEGGFQGERRRMPLPEVDSPVANPVILYFLEQEVREMQRRTRGQASHFRRHIRLSLVDQATVEATTIRWDGREWPAQEIRVLPYLQDPMRSRYARYAAKQVAVVLAEGVPGGVYQLRTLLPDAEPGNPALLEETLALAEPAGVAPTSPERSTR